MLIQSENGNDSFKPQRGKFTQELYSLALWIERVSNPNGVNLHSTKTLIFRAICDKSLYFQTLKQPKFNRSKNLKHEYIAICETYKKLYRRIKQRNTSKNGQTRAAKVKIIIMNKNTATNTASLIQSHSHRIQNTDASFCRQRERFIFIRLGLSEA